MSASQPALFNVQEFTDDGITLVGGRLYTYAYGTTAQKVAYTDPEGTIPQTYTADGMGGQYIGLNARGELPTPLYLAAGAYDISLKRADGSTVWTRRAEPTADAAAAITTSLASISGASFVGYLQAAGLAPRTVADKLQEEISLFDFIPKAQQAGILAKTSTYDASDNIINAIVFVSLLPSGTRLVAPRGKFVCSKSIQWKNNVTLVGKSKVATVFEFTHTGHGFISSNPINSSTAAYIGISNCTITTSNPDSTGSGFYDTASSYVDLTKVKITKFDYGIIIDQTEHCHISVCELAFNKTGGVWFVNGPTLTPGVSNGFTNVVRIQNCQFNSTGIGIIDDGGGSHTFDGNNFNGGVRAMRIAGAGTVRISNNAMEYSVEELVWISNLRFSGGAVGAAGNIIFDTNGLISSNDKHTIWLESCNTLTLVNNYFETQAISTTKACVGNTGGCYNLTTLGNKWNYYKKLLDTIPFRSLQMDSDDTAIHTQTQFYAADPTKTPLETYSPSMAGGGVSIGGIALSANNSAGTKTRYAALRPSISSNGVGVETGSMNIELMSTGVSTTAYTITMAGFRPGADNTQTCGGSSTRWSVVYAGTGTINTSDAREKVQIEEIPDAALRAIRKVPFKRFKYRDAVMSKAELARWHFGVIAQDVQAAFESEGLNAFEYGLLCFDAWDEIAEVKDGDGNVIVPYSPAGNRYGIRYDELLCLKMMSIEIAVL